MSITQARPANALSIANRAPKKRSFFARRSEVLLGITGLMVMLLAWQVCAWTGLIDTTFTSSPIGALTGVVNMVQDGTLWGPLRATLSSIWWGMLISLGVGIPLGLIIGRSKLFYGLTEQMISIMYSVPFVVFLPLVIFWFGIGQEARIVIVVWSAIFPLLINVIAGARNIPRDFLQVSQVFCASRSRTLWSVALPATLPYILAGVRQAVGRALVGAIVAELFMGTQGLGYVVQVETSNFNMDAAMAAIVVIAFVAIVLNRGVAFFERRFTGWSTTD